MKRYFAILASALLLSGCGEADPEAAPVAAPKRTAPEEAAVDDPVARMARAVGDRKPGAAVELRYDIASRPEVGIPTQIKLAFIPSAGVDALSATLTGMDGITIAGNLQPQFEQVQAGKPYEHTFSLLPDREGVYYVTVAVTSSIGGASVGRTFSVPFVVGTRTAQRQKPTPPEDATGQAIESMPAEEPRSAAQKKDD
jgi:hypothetical protein